MKITEFTEKIRDEFYGELEAKTSWGRNEVKAVFENVIITVLAQELDKGLKGY